MAKNNQLPDESEDFDMEDEDFFSYDAELDDEGDDDNDDFNLESLTPKERKRYEKMRSEIEDKVIELIASGDTNNKVYKGLQKVLSKRDKDLAETRNALSLVLSKLGGFEEAGSDIEFIKGIMQEMLDEEGKVVFNNKYENHKTKLKTQRQEEMMNQLFQQRQAQEIGYQRYGQEEEDPRVREYKKKATEKLKAFAKKMGVNPEDNELDYGDEDEALLDRMEKLSSSIEKIQEKEINTVRRSKNLPNTKRDTDPTAKSTDYDLDRSFAELAKKMRNL